MTNQNVCSIIGNMSREDSDVLIVELAKDQLREAIEYGFYDEALHIMSVLIEDSPTIGLAVYRDLIGFWQECYDMTINVPNHGRRVISFIPKSMREKDEENGGGGRGQRRF